MIIRILTEGQYRVDDSLHDRLNALDNALVEAVTAGEQERFQALFRELLDTVRHHGTPLPPEEFVESDLILPPPDTTLEEARQIFAGEGLIPG